MIIKITVNKGVVVDVETSEPALVQIVDADCDEISTFETVDQAVTLEPDDPATDSLLNHEIMQNPLHTLFVDVCLP